MITKEKPKQPRSDGLGGVRFVVKSLVIVSFLVLITGYNYYTTGEVPSLWNTGDGLSTSADHAMQFVRRKLTEDDDVRCKNRLDSF